MKRFIGIVALLGTALLLSASGARAEEPKALGAFKLKTGEGTEITEAAFKGKTTLFVVAQTACSQCQTELKEINDNLDKVKAKAEVWVILVDANGAQGLDRYGKTGYKMPVIVDEMFKLPTQAGIEVTPGTFIVNKDLKVTFVKTGYRPGSLDGILEKL